MAEPGNRGSQDAIGGSRFGTRSQTAGIDTQRLYLSLIEELPALVCCKDIEGRFTVVSRSYAEMLGVQPVEVIGKSDFDFYSRELAEKFRLEDQQVLETGEMLISTEESRRDGRERYFALRKAQVHDSDGKVVGVQTIFWDITDEHLAEKSLQGERDMLQTIMDNLPDFIYVKDIDGRYVVINDAVRKILGAATIGDVVGKANYDFLPEDQASAERADDDLVIQTGEALIEREECMKDRDGNNLWVLTSKLPLRDSEGQVSGLVGIDRNITHLKESQADLRSARDMADEANRAKGDFLANMSHEIRTPMNAIIGMTDLLLETQLTQTQREYLSMVQDSGEALLSLINDILDFSKIEAGKLELESAVFDIRECLGDTMKSLGLRAYQKGLELAVNIDPAIPGFLIGDPGRIRQIVVNLIGNAIKFTEHGEVVLEIEMESQTDDEATLHFSVTDTGIGISQDQCDKVFGEFEQADASTTRRFGGTGLGLAICARLAGMMNGRIWVESELGRGSKFQFTAVVGVDHTRQKQVVPEHMVSISGMRALVVDDNATNRRIFKEMLTSWGMLPATASGASQAVQVLRDAREEQDPIQLVVSDVNMPDQDGISLARQILDEKLLPGSSIIMLTSGARPEDGNSLKSIGVNQYLMKPIKQSELFTAMVASLGETAGPAAQVDAEIPASTTSETGSLKILLAEDNIVNQKLALGILGGLGHHVTVVDNGRAAVEAIGLHPFDLVLMDVQMPEMDGLDATREIRRREITSGTHVPIVAMTAHAMKGDREACLEAGMDDYLTKPIRLQHISGKLHELFPYGAARPDSSVSDNHEAGAELIQWEMALKSVGGDKQLFREVIQEFLSDTPRLLAAAQENARQGDVEALGATAHSLKGSLLFLHAHTAFESAHRIELTARTGDVEQARQELQAFEEPFGTICQLLQSWLQAQPRG
ncbi:MAG: response regulator [Pirellulaceae bacterium]